MSIIFGIILPAVLFLITLPLKSLLFLWEQQVKILSKRKKGSLSDKLGLGDEADLVRKGVHSSKKVAVTSVKATKKTIKMSQQMTKLTIKAMKLTIRALKLLIHLLRIIAQCMIFLITSGAIILIVIAVALIASVSSIIMFMS